MWTGVFCAHKACFLRPRHISTKEESAKWGFEPTSHLIYDTGLKFHQHVSEVAMKANRVLACIRRGFANLNDYVLLRL